MPLKVFKGQNVKLPFFPLKIWKIFKGGDRTQKHFFKGQKNFAP